MLSTACTSNQEKSFINEHQVKGIPAHLLVCLPRPEKPVLNSDVDLAEWILDLDFAGQDCRDKLNTVRESYGD